MRRLALAALLVLGLAAPSPAAFEDVPIGARSVALGASDVAAGNEMQQSFLNPAALAGVNRWEAFMAYDKSYIGLSDGSSIGRQVFAVGAPFRFGTFSLGMDKFSAGGLYNEDATFLGFGRQVGKKTWIGLNFKQMSVKYAQDQYTAANPVFKAGSSKSAMGLDIGFTRVGQRSRWALSIINGNEPDLGIKYSNKVDRRVNLGYSVRVVEGVTLDPAISLVGKDYRVRFGVERQARKSNFAFRGGLNLGSREYRNFAVGLGYRRRVIQIDYAMNFPLSGVATTMGTHQLGLTARWGRPKRRVALTEDEDEQLDDELENRREVVKSKAAPVTQDDRDKAREALEEAKKDLLSGQLARALERLQEADPALVGAAEVEEAKALAGRAITVAQIYPDLRGSDDKSRLLRQAVSAYLAGEGKRAVNAATYAAQLHPKDQKIAALRAVIGKAFPLEVFELKLVPGVPLTDQKLQESLELIYDGKYTAAIALCKEVLEFEPENVLAMVRMGSAYWAMGMRRNARNVWEKALSLDPNNEVLKQFLGRKLEEEATEQAPPKPSVVPRPQVQEEFAAKMAYYERLKRSGADPATLSQILQRIIEKYEGSGVDLTDAYKEFQQLKR